MMAYDMTWVEGEGVGDGLNQWRSQGKHCSTCEIWVKFEELW